MFVGTITDGRGRVVIAINFVCDDNSEGVGAYRHLDGRCLPACACYAVSAEDARQYQSLFSYIRESGCGAERSFTKARCKFPDLSSGLFPPSESVGWRLVANVR